MGRSKVISIPSTSSHCRTSCNMKKLLLFVFLGLVALTLSENLGEEQGNNVEEALDESELENIEVTSEDEDESVDVSRSKRDADPKKKRKNKGKKSQKNKNKPRNGKKKNRKNKRKQNKRGKKIRKVVPSSGEQRGACSRAVN